MAPPNSGCSIFYILAILGVVLGYFYLYGLLDNDKDRFTVTCIASFAFSLLMTILLDELLEAVDGSAKNHTDSIVSSVVTECGKIRETQEDVKLSAARIRCDISSFRGKFMGDFTTFTNNFNAFDDEFDVLHDRVISIEGGMMDMKSFIAYTKTTLSSIQDLCEKMVVNENRPKFTIKPKDSEITRVNGLSYDECPHFVPPACELD